MVSFIGKSEDVFVNVSAIFNDNPNKYKANRLSSIFLKEPMVN